MVAPSLTVHVSQEPGQPLDYETNCFMCQPRGSGLTQVMPLRTVKVRIVDHERANEEHERWMCGTCLDIARRDGRTAVVEPPH